MLSVNFPLVSSVCSKLPSIPYMKILPEWLPVITCFESGEKATVQMSTGPASIVQNFLPFATSHSLIVESRQLAAITV